MEKNKRLVVGHVYAVTTGQYLGEFLVYIKANDINRCFLSLPKMINRQIEKRNIENAIKKRILEFQEKLPRSIRSVCIEQYKKNEKTIH